MRFLLNLIGSLILAAGLTVLLIEFIVGCGETYVDANGERHAYECVFIPQPVVESK
jgi:hypothetical protein